MKQKNEAHESMATYGAKSVSDLQLLEVLGIPENAARELLFKAENTMGTIARMTIQEISTIKGIGTAKAASIVAAVEIGRRRQTEKAVQRSQISSSTDIYDLIHAQMRDYTQEVFMIILLDRRCKVIRIEEIHVGGMNAMVVDPKVVFQKALMYRASSIVLIHNHPSGAPSPSMEDIRLTEKMKLAGNYIDINVLDHVIIGDGSYYSFADEGKI